MDNNWVKLRENVFSKLFIGSCYVNVEENTYCLIGGEDEQDEEGFIANSYDEMIQEYVDTMIHPDDQAIVTERCDRTYLVERLGREKFFYFDCRRLADGEYRWHRMHIVAEKYDKNGKVKYVLLSNMYIDDMKKEEFEYREKIEAANRAKTDFLSNMSHDLRTPMNAIMGFMTLIERDADNPNLVREDARKLKASGRHLLSIINDVLDMNKVENGVMQINNAEFELSVFLEDINTVMSQLTREKTQNFFMELENVTTNWVVGDKARLSQILMNVLSNSAKYTGECGDIRLIVRQLPMEDKHHLVFIVRDNGIGMEEEFLSKIYEPFAREEVRIPNDVTGTGLGMSITKKLVDLMGGLVEVKSAPGKGTEFKIDIFFDIPAIKKEVKPLEHKPIDKKGAKLSNKNFLIAEDNKANGEIISRLLEIEGAKSLVCHNGRSVVETFFDNPINTFDMILMDVRMPVLDGYEATRLIRQNERADAKTIPIISMTANAFLEDVQLALEAGMNAHVSKPIDFEILKATIRKFI